MIQDRPHAEVGGKALWTKELDRCLADGRTDISVHSMKDVETFRPAEFRIAAMLPRADVRDLLDRQPVAGCRLVIDLDVEGRSPRRLDRSPGEIGRAHV